MLLEETFKLDNKPSPLVVHDFQVIAHIICNDVEPYKEIYIDEVLDRIIKANWALRVNRGPDCLPLFEGYHIIIVNDLKFAKLNNYWREVEISKDVRMEFVWESYWETKKNGKPKNYSESYKGSREKKKDFFLRVVEIGMKYCKKYFNFYEMRGFEADDIASAIFRQSRDYKGVCRDRQILFHTVDRDWTQLVDDHHKCFWANTRYPRGNEKIQHRLAGNKEVIEHTLHKYNIEIGHPRELIDVKSPMGDIGDNLPPGTPHEYMDLVEPPEQWKVENTSIWWGLQEEINTDVSNVQLGHYFQSKQQLEKAKLLPKGFFPSPEG